MKTEYKIISANDFIKAKPGGDIDLEQSKRVLADIALLNEPPADYEILFDVRLCTGHLTYADFYEFVAELGRHRSSFRNKIAFVTRNDEQFDRGRFLQLCAVNRGFKVAVFHDFEEATEWLQQATEVQNWPGISD